MPSNLQVPFPPDPNPTTPRFKAPPGTCDTHFHIMGPPEVFPFVASRLYTPPAAPVEHYLKMAKVIGIERGVLVVPAVHGFDNRVMHDAIAKAEGRLKGMVRANPEASEADNKALHDQGVRGIRFNLRPSLNGRIRRGRDQAHRLAHPQPAMVRLPPYRGRSHRQECRADPPPRHADHHRSFRPARSGEGRRSAVVPCRPRPPGREAYLGEARRRRPLAARGRRVTATSSRSPAR